MTTPTEQKPLSASTIVLLGVLTALATVVNNLYSPAMLLLCEHYDASPSQIQFGLTAAMLGLALGQIIIGPLTDRYGRRTLPLWSMAGFTAVSAAAPFSPSLPVLYGFRFAQGFLAGGGIVISRSVATDSASGTALVRVLAVMNVVNGIAPIVTPMLSTWLSTQWGWTAVFAAMTGVGALLVIWTRRLPETLTTPTLTQNYWSGLWRVWTMRRFSLSVGQQCGALIFLFGNIALTPFLITHEYGMSPKTIGCSLALNGVFTTLGAGFAARRDAGWGIRVSAVGMTAAGIALTAVVAAQMGYWAYEAVMCATLFFVGMTLTSSSSQAMDAGRAYTGSASAMLGAAGFVVGGITAPLMGLTAPAAIFCFAAVTVFSCWTISNRKT